MIARGNARTVAWASGSRLMGGLLAGMLAAGGFASAAHAQASGSATLDAVKARGVLVCGVAGDTAGFSLPDSKGVMQGIDAEECRAVAAAVLGDASKVKFSPLTTQNRFTALQSGEVDVLIRETTWTLGRQASLGFLFAPINFYDGTGFLVKKAAGVSDVKALDGATVCVQPGTSTELAIADYFRANNLKFTPIEIENLQQIQQAFLSGRCDAYSTDSSALAGFRFTQGDKASRLRAAADDHQQGAAGSRGPQGRRQVVRHRLLGRVRADDRRGRRREREEHRHVRVVDQPRRPPPARVGRRSRQGARPR